MKKILLLLLSTFNIQTSLLTPHPSTFNMYAAERMVSYTRGDMLLCQKGETIKIYVDNNDNSAVRIAAQNLANDINKVSGANVTITTNAAEARIIVGSMGHSSGIDALVRQGIVNAKDLKGKREKYIISTLPQRDGRGEALVIAGSDRRGAAYGIYELSRQIGVSPWYYWMDAPIVHHDKVYAIKGTYTDGEPAVRYRGIFLNDEAPCLTSWVKHAFGTGYGGHEFYAKVCELIMRLKGNYMWPAMWGWAFYADDPLNSKTANDMGVMVGTSHHEPMSRSQQEWTRHMLGNKQWNYSTNKAALDSFWLGGVERNKDTEDIITIGMRGDGDMAMSEERNTKLLEEVVDNQRRLISKARGCQAKEVPQLWALYKEVQDYYDDGMRVPDDVTMLLCDDNWGNVRRVPTARERRRSGGWGLYYHVDYVGAPRNTKLLNVTPIQNMWEQLTLAYDYGIDRLWILNVGDLKPMEYPIQLFMDMAWDMDKYRATGSSTLPEGNAGTALSKHTLDFCNSLFGCQDSPTGNAKAGVGAEAARILNLLCKYNGRCTPEMLDSKTYNLGSGEWAEVVDEYKTLERDALRQYAELPSAARDAYYELILFPVQLMANLHEMYYAQAMNNTLHEAGDAAQNEWADRCEQCFRRDGELMHQYNKDLAGGKWDGMMTQKHIGYTTWQDNFDHDTMPALYRMTDPQNIFDEDGHGYVAMEAEHYQKATEPKDGRWTVIPGMGRTLSAMEVMPQTASVDGASLSYRFGCSKGGEKVKVHIITRSTLDFLNKGGLVYSLMMDGCAPVDVNFNSDLNESPDNIYSIYYPTIARRVVEKVIDMPLGATADFLHTLTFLPRDPGIVLEKIIIDLGSYRQQYLFGKESKRR